MTHPDLADLPLHERVRTLLAYRATSCGLTAREVADEGMTVNQATRALVVLRRRTFGGVVREPRWRLRDEEDT